MYSEEYYAIIKNSDLKQEKEPKIMGKKRIAIVTDSNSGITQKQGKEMGITVLPMPFYINEQLF